MVGRSAASLIDNVQQPAAFVWHNSDKKICLLQHQRTELNVYFDKIQTLISCILTTFLQLYDDMLRSCLPVNKTWVDVWLQKELEDKFPGDDFFDSLPTWNKLERYLRVNNQSVAVLYSVV